MRITAMLAMLAVGSSVLQAAAAPVKEFADRASVDMQQTALNLSVYDDADMAQSWYGRLPAHLRRVNLDQGLGHTAELVDVQTAYTVDKIIRSHADSAQNLTIVDAGAGGGHMALKLGAIPGWRIIALDQSVVALGALSEQLRRPENSEQRKSVELETADLTSAPLDDASADALVAFSVLEQVPQLRAALREAHRVLRDDGILVFLTVNRSWQSKLSLWLHTTFVQHHPPQAADWRLGVKPVEMKRIAHAAGFNLVHEELQGVCENLRLHVDWGKFPWVLQAHGTAYSPCKSLQVRYMGWAYKQPARIAPGGVGGATAAGRDEL